jgi:hypothetical protein
MPSHAELSELDKHEAQPSQPSLSPQQQTYDWSGWEKWLQGHLNIEHANLHRALGRLLAAERRKFADQLERKTSEFEVKLAKLAGAIDVLNGNAPLRAHLDIERETLHGALGRLLAAERREFSDQLERKTRELELELAKLTDAIVVLPPPAAKFPTVKSWKDGVHYEGDVVTFAGSTYQALRDTGTVPGSADPARRLPQAPDVAARRRAARRRWRARRQRAQGDLKRRALMRKSRGCFSAGATQSLGPNSKRGSDVTA